MTVEARQPSQREEAEKVTANLKNDHIQIAEYVVQRCGDFNYDHERRDLIAEFLRAAALVRAGGVERTPETLRDALPGQMNLAPESSRLDAEYAKGWNECLTEVLKVVDGGETKAATQRESRLSQNEQAWEDLRADGGLPEARGAVEPPAFSKNDLTILDSIAGLFAQDSSEGLNLPGVARLIRRACEALRGARPSPPPADGSAKTDERGWVLEGKLSGGEIVYWDGRTRDSESLKHEDAVRFARREDAEKIRLTQTFKPDYWTSVQHLWFTPAVSPPPATPQESE